MYQSPSYPKVSEDALEAFVRENFHGKCIAINADGFPEVSLLPFEYHKPTANSPQGWFDLHLVQADRTFQALQSNPRCAFMMDQPLAFTPHYVVDPMYAGLATLHFRAVRFQCMAMVSTDPAEVARVLDSLVRHYEPGTSFHPVTDQAFYQGDLSMLGVARLEIVSWEAKFKLAQNRTPEQQEVLSQFLRDRKAPLDEIALKEMRKAWDAAQSPDTMA